MSVLIKGMNVPSECEYCALCRFYPDTKRVWCNAANKVLKLHWEHPDWTHLNVKRPDWCPLVEVPTPHGRLIDADDAFIDADERGFDFWSCDADIDSAQDFLRAQPTIIEAEEE